MSTFRKFLYRWSLRNKNIMSVYIRLYRPDGFEYAVLLKATERLHHIGINTCITLGANITDPAYVSIGDNCTLSVCTILGHDGVVRVLNNAYGKKLDSVGKTDIRDNCFIGHGSILMPDLTIGPNSIVAAGAVVTKDVPPNSGGWAGYRPGCCAAHLTSFNAWKKNVRIILGWK